MMIKYKVSEIARDLKVAAKDIAAALAEHSDGNAKKKNAQSTLTEEELNIVFEHFTQKNKGENFDAYVSLNKENSAEAKSEPNKDKDGKKQGERKLFQRNDKQKKNQNNQNNNQKSEDKPKNDNRKRNDKPEQKNTQAKEKAPAVRNNPAKEQAPKSSANTAANANTTSAKDNVVSTEDNGGTTSGRRSRVIDTRAGGTNINIDKYSEKYDDLANQKMKTDNTVSKQKINQKSQRKGKPRNSRKETEQERLKRIAAERKSKPITVSIPDEIVVSELAMRLKVTASEVVKVLFSMGQMATVNDVIDFDTASLAAMELHAKVEHEVVVTIEERIIDDSEDADENLVERAPVVVVMGHVDHGKTSLLDAIREEKQRQAVSHSISVHTVLR